MICRILKSGVRKTKKMDLNLQGKTALVTGGSKGIGRAIALLLAEEGCHLHLAARTEADLKTVQADIASVADVDVTLHPLDIADSSNVAKLAAAAAGIDILVNNAGAIPGGTLATIDEETWRAGWELKVFGYINLTREIYAGMREAGGGVIINVIGTGGERPDATYIAGAAGNAGLMAFTRAMGAKSPDHGIRMVAVNPGLTVTDRMETQRRRAMEARGLDPDSWRENLPKLPFGRPGNPEEVADLVAFLASDRASYISGTVITIDGGQSSKGTI